MGRKILIFIIMFLCVANFAYSEEITLKDKSEVQMSFEEAYELMLNNNYALKAIYEEVKEKEYKKKSALGQFAPKVVADVSYARLSKNIGITTATPIGTLNTPIQDKNLFETSIGGVWNVFTGGKILALNKAARASLEAVNEKYKLTKNDLTFELVKRYYGLSLAKDVSDVKKEFTEDVQRHLEDAKKLEKEGIISKSERLHAEVAYKQALKNYKSAKRDVLIINEALKALIKDESANVSQINIVPVSNLFVYKGDMPNVQDFQAKALGNNPLIKQMQAKKKIAKAKYMNEISNYSPVISLFAYDIPAKSTLSDLVPTWSMGVSANMLLFNGFSRFNDVKAANAFKKQVDYEIQDVNINIETLVNKQYQEFKKYEEELETTEAMIESAKEALRVVALGFREGYATSLEVVDAELTLESAKLARLNAIYNYDVSLADLLRTCGDTAEITEYINSSDKEKLK